MQLNLTIGTLLLALSGVCLAHGSTVGQVFVDHPYAVVSAGPQASLSAHFRALRNRGNGPDRLLTATTSAARKARLQVRIGGEHGEFRDLDGIDLPPGADVPFRYDGALRILLEGPVRAWHVGDRFAMRLQFQHSGAAEIQVWVQEPKGPAPDHAIERGRSTA